MICSAVPHPWDGRCWNNPSEVHPHDGRPAADVGAVADDDAGGDASLHHRGAERARVEVHEALVHDDRAGGEVCTEANPARVGDTHP
jgi:hypothetical protein